MEPKKILLTPAEDQRLRDELEDLTINQKQANVEKIKEAKEQGDLSENAEYDAAREEQRKICERIAEIENILKNSEVVEVDTSAKGVVNVGSVVTVMMKKPKKEFTFTIVGATEVNSRIGKISNESPVGAALIGHKKGDKVEVELPAGIVQYEILDVKKAGK